MWQTRELAILRAVVQAEEIGEDANAAAFAATDLPLAEVIRCLARLHDDGYLDVRLNPGDNTILSAHVVKALPKALREVEHWPAPAAVLEHSRRQRLIVMQHLRAVRGDDTLNPIGVDDIAAANGLTADDLASAVNYLSSEGLIEHHWGNQVSLTQAGLVEMEALERKPDQPTPHLPAINITIGDNASGVQISAGSPGSSQHLELSSNDIDIAAQFVHEFQRVLPCFRIDETERTAIAARLDAATVLLASPQPDHTTLRPLLRGLRDVALGVAGNAAFAGLVELAGHLRF